jgi:hypothetical protein
MLVSLFCRKRCLQFIPLSFSSMDNSTTYILVQKLHRVYVLFTNKEDHCSMEWAELGAEFENSNNFLACTLCGGHKRRKLKVSLDTRTPLVGMQHPCLWFHTDSFTGNKTAISQCIDLCMVPNNTYDHSFFRNQFLKP